MENYVTFELPKNFDSNDIDSLSDELKAIDEIEDAGSGTSRSIDPSSIMIWIGVFGSIIASIDKAVPVFVKIKSLFQKKEIKGVKIIKPDGTTISIDDTSADQIVELLKED